MIEDNLSKLEKLFNKYQLNLFEKEELKRIIMPIFIHQEFQKRMTDPFLHHGNITLGEHILEDAIVTYKLSQKYIKKYPNYRMDLAIKIAMFHDLYTVPWQNNNEARTKKFLNKHGFRHPIESVINAMYWYPDFFQNENDSQIIIDGIIHHMYPLPVRKSKLEKMELKNLDLLYQLPDISRELFIDNIIGKGPISLRRSYYKEGRIMSKADKKVSFHQIKDFSSAKALLTGHNKKLK